MPNPFGALPELFDNFASLCHGGAAEALVTVRQLDPDSGATLATAENVTAIKRSRRRQPFGVEGGGEVGADSCRFLLRASEVSFLPKARDEVTDNGGVAWVMDKVEAIGFHAIYACDVTLKRS